MRRRMEPDKRKEIIVEAALECAKQYGYLHTKRSQIARKAKSSPALITYYFGGMGGMRAAIMEEAVKREIIDIVGIGIAMCDEIALAAPEDLKEKAVQHLTR